MSHIKSILKHLKSGKTLTKIQALNKFNCFSLAQRIADIKDLGYDVKTDMVKIESNKRIAKYKLVS